MPVTWHVMLWIITGDTMLTVLLLPSLGMAGENNLEMAQVDSLVDLAQDIQAKLFAHLSNGTLAKVVSS